MGVFHPEARRFQMRRSLRSDLRGPRLPMNYSPFNSGVLSGVIFDLSGVILGLLFRAGELGKSLLLGLGEIVERAVAMVSSMDGYAITRSPLRL
jgi:hypothetical protein